MVALSVRCCLIWICPLVLSISASPAAADERLPVNCWVKVDEEGGGVRRGAAVAWLEDERRFLIVGGNLANEKKEITQRYEVQTFDPRGQVWTEEVPAGIDLAGFPKSRLLLRENEAGRLRLSPAREIASNSVCDPGSGRLFVYSADESYAADKFFIAAYDVAAHDWLLLTTTKPPTKADGVLPGEYNPTMSLMEGATIVHDPIHHQLLLLGGRTGNADDGFVGHWSFSLEDRQWRELRVHSAVLDPLRERCLAIRRPGRDGLAALRNLWYQPDSASTSSAAWRRAIDLLNDAARHAATAAAALETARADGWQAEAIRRAAELVAPAAAQLQSAHESMNDGELNPALILRVSDAVWDFDEAADLLRAMPGPRMYASAAYDPQRQCIVLFGGDHGDYLLSDTWIYDCRQQSWRQVFPRRVPEARRGAGNMDWLPRSKQLFLAGGESYVPKFIYFRRPPRQLHDVWIFDSSSQCWSLVSSVAKGEGENEDTNWPTLTCQIAADADDTLLGLASEGTYPVN